MSTFFDFRWWFWLLPLYKFSNSPPRPKTNSSHHMVSYHRVNFLSSPDSNRNVFIISLSIFRNSNLFPESCGLMINLCNEDIKRTDISLMPQKFTGFTRCLGFSSSHLKTVIKFFVLVRKILTTKSMSILYLKYLPYFAAIRMTNESIN